MVNFSHRLGNVAGLPTPPAFELVIRSTEWCQRGNARQGLRKKALRWARVHRGRRVASSLSTLADRIGGRTSKVDKGT